MGKTQSKKRREQSARTLSETTKAVKPSYRNIDIILCILLVLVVLAGFWRATGFQFTKFDDNVYITENDHVQHGLVANEIAWAFKSGYAANWHPLTWISHMVDWSMFGPKPMGPHVVNILFHAANAILLFLVLLRMTGCRWRSAFVAALFAVHPLHVESVAWVVERKDVLSTFFWMLTILAYLRYVEKPGIIRYIPILLAFALGLMAKPMLVTLPLVLLMLDYWPLRRFRFSPSPQPSPARG